MIRGGCFGMLLVWSFVSTAVWAEDFEARVPALPGGKLSLHISSGEVEIESHDQNEVRVDARARGFGPGGANFRVVPRRGDVEVRGAAPGWLSFGSRMRVRVRVPFAYSVDVSTSGGDVNVEQLRGSVRVKSSGSRIEIGQIEGDIDLDTSGGEIQAQEIFGEVRVRTSGGSIKLSEIRGEVDARTSGGSIEVDGVAGGVNARTSGGSIAVRFVADVAGRIETSGGNIQIRVPGRTNIDLDAVASGGGIEIERELRPQGRRKNGRFRGALGRGGESLALRTSGGSIYIQPD